MKLIPQQSIRPLHLVSRPIHRPTVVAFGSDTLKQIQEIRNQQQRNNPELRKFLTAQQVDLGYTQLTGWQVLDILRSMGKKDRRMSISDFIKAIGEQHVDFYKADALIRSLYDLGCIQHYDNYNDSSKLTPLGLEILEKPHLYGLAPPTKIATGSVGANGSMGGSTARYQALPLQLRALLAPLADSQATGSGWTLLKAISDVTPGRLNAFRPTRWLLRQWRKLVPMEPTLLRQLGHKLTPTQLRKQLQTLEAVGLVETQTLSFSTPQWRLTDAGRALVAQGDPNQPGALTPQQLKGLVELEQQRIEERKAHYHKQLETFQAELIKTEKEIQSLQAQQAQLEQKRGTPQNPDQLEQLDRDAKSLQKRLDLETRVQERLRERLERTQGLVKQVLIDLAQKEEQLLEASVQIRLIHINQSLVEMEQAAMVDGALPNAQQSAIRSALNSVLAVIQQDYHRSEVLYSLTGLGEPSVKGESTPGETAAPLQALLAAATPTAQESH